MCNPPFYESEKEMISSAEAKQRPPFSVSASNSRKSLLSLLTNPQACTGANVEMVTVGGEISFVTRMIQESLELRERVQWYTSMLGKLSSVSVLVEKLMEHGNHNYAVTEFVQGNKTKRWAIAWSWTDLRPAMSVARGITGFPKHLLPFPSEFSFQVPEKSIDATAEKIDTEISSLPIQWHWRPVIAAGVGFAMENVWSRQARRKRRNQDSEVNKDEIDEKKATFGFKVQVKQERASANGVTVQIRWLKGTDTVLFESFCGMLKRKVEER
ncbi:hypothetical protein Plec18167_007926 [Paecilomyces lecythidis]|uniref:U6 small nuclear RNA (adenine-(43)-N(6))-methyltransferase n=1 Tax=Paecilomyces lecythidis TaxID=3004212 RepID=A0ABR3X041_9EURO